MAADPAGEPATSREARANQDSNTRRAIVPPRTSPDFLYLRFDCPSHNQADRVAYDMIEFAEGSWFGS
ncbi:hypothetical protein [[Phormidium] sp. ETS-05]|uniref:hypothetical protein n=1 Tax=[Phormidium] sp. ETS-05 TaxID=222819 RepID=UPI0018EF1745|nr:hypothetical protein [[Phormidium] sp. ETS-05]